MAIIQEKQVRIITIALAAIVTLFIGILGFRLLSESLVKAEDISPKNMAINEIQENSARIKWSTDRETQSIIEYGTSPTALTFFAPEALKTKEHNLELNLLTAGTTYYFQVRTGDKKFDNGGVPWTFTTLGQGEELTSPTPAEELTSTPSATIALTTTAPTPTTAASTKDTKCSFNEYKNYFNTTNTKYDQDDNGIVNLRDWSLCNSKYGTLAPSSTPTPVLSPTITPNPS